MDQKLAYEVLGIEENTYIFNISLEYLKKQYRKMALRYHPDKNGGNQESINMTQKINEAYETLGDEEKRKEYDFTRNNPNPFFRMNQQPNDVPMDDIFVANVISECCIKLVFFQFNHESKSIYKRFKMRILIHILIEHYDLIKFFGQLLSDSTCWYVC